MKLLRGRREEPGNEATVQVAHRYEASVTPGPGPAPYLATLTAFSFVRSFHLDVVFIWTYFSFVRSFHLDVLSICT